MGLEVVEQFVQSRSGIASECEDEIVVTSDFAFVIDGATAKTSESFGGLTGGRAAALAIAQVVRRLGAQATLRDACEEFRRAVAELGGRADAGSGALAAVFVGYSVARREVWRVGDCQWCGAEEVHGAEKRVDAIAAAARRALLHGLLLGASTVEGLREEDPGREMILPLLREQHRFANRDEHQFGYGVVDGGSIPQRFLETWSTSETRELTLASDGYPVLCPSLSETERALEEDLRVDPLRIGAHPATKASPAAGCSYDDRAYLRLRLT